MSRSRSVAILVAVALLGVQSLAPCQTKPAKATPAKTKRADTRRVILSIGGGFGLPVTRDGIKQFWTGGPVGSIGILFGVNPSFATGLGFEGAFLPFNETAFVAAYPTVPVHHQDIGLMHLFLEGKYTPFAKYRLAPYVAGTLGAARLSNAECYDVIGGKRVTYYSIKSITRFAAGMALGTDLSLSRSVIAWAELKATYIHNDPNIGLWTSLVGGVRFVL